MWAWMEKFQLLYLIWCYICNELTQYMTLKIWHFWRKKDRKYAIFIVKTYNNISVAKTSTNAPPGQSLQKKLTNLALENYCNIIAIYCIKLNYCEIIAIIKKSIIAHGCSILTLGQEENRHFRIWTKISTFETWDPSLKASDIWSEWWAKKKKLIVSIFLKT